MLCRKPFTGLAVPFGCGQCLPCRINRRRVWVTRQVLEAAMHKENSFLTLTYNDAHLPAGGHLQPEELQLWLKRFRKSLGLQKLRYVAVGEYGDHTKRPHYHLSLFGVGPGTANDLLINSTWSSISRGSNGKSVRVSKGFHKLAEFNIHTAQYVAGYVMKWASRTPPGLRPEFARMSRAPGIGAVAVELLSDALSGPQVAAAMGQSDVPRAVLLGRKGMPLGRLLRAKLREALGFSEDDVAQLRSEWLKEVTPELQALRAFHEAHWADGKTFAERIVDVNIQKILNVEARARVFKKRITL